MISAASHQVIFFAIAFNKTSCSFIIRSVSAAGYCCEVFNLQIPPPLFQSGQFMCEFDRTFHILTTGVMDGGWQVTTPVICYGHVQTPSPPCPVAHPGCDGADSRS